jgi:hypothetical protein
LKWKSERHVLEMEDPATSQPRNANSRARHTICSRLKRLLKGPPKSVQPAHQNQEQHEATTPYRHVPMAAASSFLRTTTKRDMFELSRSSSKRPLVSGEADAADLKDSQKLERLVSDPTQQEGSPIMPTTVTPSRESEP